MVPVRILATSFHGGGQWETGFAVTNREAPAGSDEARAIAKLADVSYILLDLSEVANEVLIDGLTMGTCDRCRPISALPVRKKGGWNGDRVPPAHIFSPEQPGRRWPISTHATETGQTY